MIKTRRLPAGNRRKIPNGEEEMSPLGPSWKKILEAQNQAVSLSHLDHAVSHLHLRLPRSGLVPGNSLSSDGYCVGQLALRQARTAAQVSYWIAHIRESSDFRPE